MFSFLVKSKKKYRGDLLDIYLATEARQMNQTVGNLESPEYHCEVDQSDFLIRKKGSFT